MSHDVADDTQGEETPEVPLTVLGLIGALARAMEDHQKEVIQPKKDAPKDLLVQSFTDDKRTDLVIEIGGQKVGHYKVNTTRPKFVVDDEAAFDAYAEEKGEIEVVIVRRKSFETAVLTHAQRDPETGVIFDSRNGEIVPGLKFVPGGKPTGTVTWTWETFKKRPVGKDVLLAAYRRGELNELLREMPELLPGAVPDSTDA
ncbi:hypothetical protein [Streptomyces griseomycini]|uniref:Uncharacterized protein n=1 Tax=Streptomyces griseomycini TaxID=66895 RepID=A0A7W7VA04_9ACTN|nr:hypothetical protein [Streptomyces griseomycini]MBB4902491.1 hypothetical protein [Streptomyces griseomycini]GGR52022.1 hypothetical protein GCM10015536_66830 [Streptomyces griseomycini]